MSARGLSATLCLLAVGEYTTLSANRGNEEAAQDAMKQARRMTGYKFARRKMPSHKGGIGIWRIE